ncbi:hypothetical protein [Streptomyces sp. JJ36]|uniref:hypothetical protein n=1 Tax=Streptomyces sp. JJ36 TaxID=2736645 RepID=UPI001F1B2EFE|nr:hypothetical protein [Streptomyces sp. JJ36]MCF6522812.1 hypothetical protein [Streptomyces sp. JJ36]
MPSPSALLALDVPPGCPTAPGRRRAGVRSLSSHPALKQGLLASPVGSRRSYDDFLAELNAWR